MPLHTPLCSHTPAMVMGCFSKCSDNVLRLSSLFKFLYSFLVFLSLSPGSWFGSGFINHNFFLFIIPARNRSAGVKSVWMYKIKFADNFMAEFLPVLFWKILMQKQWKLCGWFFFKKFSFHAKLVTVKWEEKLLIMTT